MQKEKIYGIALILMFSLTFLVTPVKATDTLSPNDFKLQSFSKTLDYFDFARAYAASHNMTPPPANWHAYLYQNYINVSGFQLYYSGLINITAGEGALSIPVQSFLEHYETPGGKDVLMSSSFITLLAFNDTNNSLFPNSPDRNDNLYASFSLGLDLTDLYGNQSKPSLSSKTTIIPLTSSDDKLTWQWGMRYTNLTAVWWRMYTSPGNPRFDALPIAITTYDELTFNYKLIINPADHTATLTSSYVIGRMTDMWLFYWIIIVPVVVHYNSTGAYTANGTKIPNGDTINQFLEKQHIKMSIVLFQNSLVLNGATTSSFNNQNVTDAQLDVSQGSITTQAANEDIFKADFGTKSTYNLLNYTSGLTDTYDVVVRTAPRLGFAKNPLFSIHVAFLRYVPLVIAHIDPSLYQRAKDHILNMTYADYFYIISYPKYSGFKVEHDPTYTAYIQATQVQAPNTAGILLIAALIAVVVIAVVVAVIFVFKKHAPRIQSTRTSTPTIPSN